MLEKRAWALKRLDHLRRALMLEPRGHADMYGALLTEPVTPRRARRRAVHAQRRLEHDVRPRHHRGHDHRDRACVDLAGAPAPERRHASANRRGADRYDTPAGPVQRARISRITASPCVGRVPQRRVVRVRAVLLVTVGGRKIPVDVAFGGAFYAIVDAEAAGVPIEPRGCPSCAAGHVDRARGRALRRVVHPNDAGLEGIYGTIFTCAGAAARRAPAQRHDLRGRRSRSLAVRHRDAAVMAVLNEMGLLLDDVPFVHESIVGTHVPRPRRRSRRGG